jgi:hypothetical protein
MWFQVHLLIDDPAVRIDDDKVVGQETVECADVVSQDGGAQLPLAFRNLGRHGMNVCHAEIPAHRRASQPLFLGEPIGITLEWARYWADPNRKGRTWTATYRFIVPSIGGMVALTFLALLFRR